MIRTNVIRSGRKLEFFEPLESRRLLAGAVAGVGTGLIANYFADTELNHLAATRVDPTVDFQFGSGSPDPGRVA